MTRRHMKNPKSVKLINDIYSRLEFLNDKKIGYPYRDQVYKLAVSGERQRRCGSDRYQLSIDAAAKYFAVKWLATHRPVTVAGLLAFRPDAQLGAMVRAMYRDEILDRLKGAGLEAFAALDYVELVKGTGE